MNEKVVMLESTELSKLVMPGALAMAFKFDVDSFQHSVYPCQWITADSGNENFFQKIPFEKKPTNKHQFKELLISHSPLLNYLHRYGFDIVVNAPKMR